MAFLYSFGVPRTQPVELDRLAGNNGTVGTVVGAAASSVGNMFSSLFSSSKKSDATQSSSSSSSSSPSTSSSVKSVDAPAPSLLEQLDYTVKGASKNISLATAARAQVQLSLATSIRIDKCIEAKRVSSLEDYTPMIAAIHAQWKEHPTEEQKSMEKSAVLQWSTVLRAGARPTADDKVPFFNYEKFNIDEELAHTYFTLALSYYQRAGSQSFRALQLANTIPPCSFLQLVPSFAAAKESPPPVTSTPARKFNPLSYEPPSEVKATPKTAAEIAQIKSEIIAERKAAVVALKQAAALFNYLGNEYLPSLPVPTMGRLPDTMPAVSQALALLCCAHIQQHTILSALIQLSTTSSSSTSAVLLSKLAQGVKEKLEESYQVLQGGTGSFFRGLEFSIHEFFKISIEYYSILRLIFLSMDAEQHAQHSRAITLLTKASERLQSSVASINLEQIRDCNVVLSEIKQWMTLENVRVVDILKTMIKDNDMVYFERVPDWSEVESTLPQGEDAAVFMAKPGEYHPQPAQALFLPHVPNSHKFLRDTSSDAAAANNQP